MAGTNCDRARGWCGDTLEASGAGDLNITWAFASEAAAPLLSQANGHWADEPIATSDDMNVIRKFFLDSHAARLKAISPQRQAIYGEWFATLPIGGCVSGDGSRLLFPKSCGDLNRPPMGPEFDNELGRFVEPEVGTDAEHAFSTQRSGLLAMSLQKSPGEAQVMGIAIPEVNGIASAITMISSAVATQQAAAAVLATWATPESRQHPSAVEGLTQQLVLSLETSGPRKKGNHILGANAGS